MQKKILLVATFINSSSLDKFLYKIYKSFGVKKNSVFFFETDTEDLLLTYKIFLEFDQKIDIRKELPKTVQIHKKGTTFFTINALNKLIEKEFNLNSGNVNYSEYNLDWSKYENSIILIKNNELDILQLKKKITE
jgi:hypothetical protein